MTETIDAIAARMKSAAEAATPGEWTRGDFGFDGCEILAEHGLIPVRVAQAFGTPDADHIAASNPANVLALIEAYDRLAALLEKAREGLKSALDGTGWGFENYRCGKRILAEIEAALPQPEKARDQA